MNSLHWLISGVHGGERRLTGRTERRHFIINGSALCAISRHLLDISNGLAVTGLLLSPARRIEAAHFERAVGPEIIRWLGLHVADTHAHTHDHPKQHVANGPG